MSLRIADPDWAWEIEVPLDGAAESALRLQVERAFSGADEPQRRAICERIGRKISDLLADALDPDLRPPTPRQIRFALEIARDLTISLPGEALRYRGAMHDFIARFSEQYYRERNRQFDRH